MEADEVKENWQSGESREGVYELKREQRYSGAVPCSALIRIKSGYHPHSSGTQDHTS